MRIVLTGGGTGGHFYPLVAVAEKINAIIDKEKIVGLKMYFMSTDPYDKEVLFENGINYIGITSGKQRLYHSWRNFTDLISIGLGCFYATIRLFFLYPDVVFSKGGYAAFPVLFAARVLRIPVIIHDSDSIPGRVSIWSSKFAEKIAIAYPEAIEYLPKEKTAWIGVPIRQSIIQKTTEGAKQFLELEEMIPTILILGGSQGAVRLNSAIINALPQLVEKYQIIHQTGVANLQDCVNRVSVVLEGNQHKSRYRPYSYLNDVTMKAAAGAATIVISRAGSSIFEIASWGLPSIIIPLPQSISRDQSHNAFAYARAGACTVVEEENLTSSVLTAQVDNLMQSTPRLEEMAKKANLFAKRDAADILARQLVDLCVSHES